MSASAAFSFSSKSSKVRIRFSAITRISRPIPKAGCEHAKTYVDMAVQRFHLDRDSQVVEIASNDGYLLRNFVDKQIPALGIEPAANVAKVAVENGIPTVVKFFGEKTAREVASGRYAGRFDHRQQCACSCAGLERLRKGPENPA